MPDQKKFQTITFKDKNFTWVNVNNPTETELNRLKRKYKFHHLDLEDCMSETQRPKIDDYDKYLFLIIHVPVRNRKKHLTSNEIDIFIGQNFVVTVHRDNNIIKQVFSACKKSKKMKEEYMDKGSGYFLYMIIDDLFESAFPLLDICNKQMNELEVEVFERNYSRDRLREILGLKKDIINFRRIIIPQRAIIAQLEHKNKKFLPEKLDVYFDDTVDKIEKMWNNLENLQELVASLQETNESIISHNTNNIIKILTIFSVIMLPLTFITGFYGMNIDTLPYADTEVSLAVIVGIMVTIAVVMISYFRYRRWL